MKTSPIASPGISASPYPLQLSDGTLPSQQQWQHSCCSIKRRNHSLFRRAGLAVEWVQRSLQGSCRGYSKDQTEIAKCPVVVEKTFWDRMMTVKVEDGGYNLKLLLPKFILFRVLWCLQWSFTSTAIQGNEILFICYDLFFCSKIYESYWGNQYLGHLVYYWCRSIKA